ncbi:hypothetical protein D3C79_962480 [compost metagenome]
MDRLYGSVDSYLKDGLGLGHEAMSSTCRLGYGNGDALGYLTQRELNPRFNMNRG